MPYRVYDTKKKKWVKDGVFLTPEGDLLQSEKSLFGNKVTFMSKSRYVYQASIGLPDKNDRMIYVGDYLKAKISEDKEVIGLVTYEKRLSSYIILCDDDISCNDTNEYFTLGQSVCDVIEVIGNVFEEPEEVKKDGKQPL